MRALWDPFFTEEVHDLLGVRAASGPLEGNQGRVWLLEDGRALKLTTSPEEAATAIALMEAPAPHGSLPRVSAVHWIPFGHSYSADRIIYAVLREEMPDPAIPIGLERRWRASFELFRRGWERGGAAALARGLAMWRGCGDELSELLDCLSWVRGSLGIRLLDLEPGNVGRLPGRGLAPRDFGVAELPGAMRGRVSALEFEPLPGLGTPAPHR